MDLLIDVLLVILTSAAVLFPFSGEVFHKNRGALSRRLTWRGWMAVICFSLSLILGVTKEIRSNTASAQSAKKQRELANTLEAVRADLTKTRESMSTANAKLSELLEEIEKLNNELLGQVGTPATLRRIVKATATTQFPSATQGVPLLKETTPSPRPGAQPASLRLPAIGDALDIKIGIVNLNMRLVGAEAFKWTYEITSLTVGENFTFRNGRFTVSPGQPANIVRGSDAALVAYVLTLPSGAKMPWVGLVPAAEAPRMSLFSTTQLILGTP